MRKFLLFLISMLILILVIEIFSFLLLLFSKQEKTAIQENFIFEKRNPFGIIFPGIDVLPVKNKLDLDWKTSTFFVNIKTNSDGFREKYEIEFSDVEYAFFGDSFTFGHGVEGDERYSYVFGQEYNTQRVLNLSYKNGFQPEHYEYFIKKNVSLKPRRVVIGVYLGNDLSSDLNETIYEPDSNHLELPYRIITESGQFGAAPNAYRWPLNVLITYSNFTKLFVKVLGRTEYRKYLLVDGEVGPNLPNPAALEMGQIDIKTNRTVNSLSRIKEVVNRRGGELTVMIIPQNFYVGTARVPHLRSEISGKADEIRNGKSLLTEFLKVCSLNQFDCLDTTEFLNIQDYIDGDGHWNSSGHRKAGIALAKHFQQFK